MLDKIQHIESQKQEKGIRPILVTSMELFGRTDHIPQEALELEKKELIIIGRTIRDTYFQTMNHFTTSTGERVSKATIDRRVRQAKQQKLEQQREEHGYNFCEDCGRSGGTYLDCSHEISVDECQKTGRAELAWDVDYIKIRCRRCHQIKDKLNIQYATS